MKRVLVAAIAALFLLALGTSALAAVSFDAETGAGFVGKGDVQLVYGWNNKQLQDNAGSVRFRVSSVSETSWTCTKTVDLGNGGTNEIVQQRSSSTAISGLLASTARERNQVTGFVLNGYSSASSTSVDGPAPGSCPATPSGFTYDGNAQTSISGGGLQVSIDGLNWFPLP